MKGPVITISQPPDGLVIQPLPVQPAGAQQARAVPAPGVLPPVEVTGQATDADRPGEPASVLLEFLSPVGNLTSATFDHWTSQIQQRLTSLSDLLTAHGLVLAGPSIALDTASLVLRAGLWIAHQDFPALPSAPPEFPLPRRPRSMI